MLSMLGCLLSSHVLYCSPYIFTSKAHYQGRTKSHWKHLWTMPDICANIMGVTHMQVKHICKHIQKCMPLFLRLTGEMKPLCFFILKKLDEMQILFEQRLSARQWCPIFSIMLNIFGQNAYIFQ